MNRRDKVVLGVGAVGAFALLTGYSKLEYGPTEQHGVRAGSQLSDVIARYGMPYDSLQLEGQTVYRWGHRRTVRVLGFNSVDNNEMLVTAGQDGRISSVTYKDKGNLGALGVLPFVTVPPH